MEGVALGGRVARRPSRPRQPLLDLRQQPHHDRGQHAHRVHGGRRGALPGLRMERAARRRRQRHRAHRARARRSSGRRRAGPRSSSSTATSATARRTSRTPPRRTASRSARTRSGSTKRAYGWPEDAQFLVPDGVREHFAAGDRRARREARREWTAISSRPTGRSIPTSPRRDRPDAAARLPAGWDRNLPVFPADAKGIAGRDASGKVLNVLAQNIPWLLGCGAFCIWLSDEVHGFARE